MGYVHAKSLSEMDLERAWGRAASRTTAGPNDLSSDEFELRLA